MANQEHLDILMQGIREWNKWRFEKPEVKPDISGAKLIDATLADGDFSWTNLSGADLGGANLVCANLTHASLVSVNFYSASLNNANLTCANFYGSSLIKADLSGAILHKALFVGARLIGTRLIGADIREADFSHASLTRVNLKGANLSHCRVYGVSAWDLKTDGATQVSLIVTRDVEPVVTVDSLEVAQFVNLLLNNQKIREVIDTVGKKAVLILGRFTPERKAVLDAIRDELRRRDYLPILFDFDKPSSRDITETISTLAHMSRFIIADITDAKSIPQELQAIVPNLPSVPVQPLLLASQHEYGMFEHFRRYPWVLGTYIYESQDALLASLQSKVIQLAETKARELAYNRNR